MAKRKSKHTDFITICETNHNLYIIAITSMPSCSLYDVINGGFSIPKRTVSHRKSSSRRIAEANTVFVAYRFRGYPTKDQETELKQNIGAITVQRDLYSAFLQSCMDTVEKPDRKKCIQLFDNFVKMQNDLITEMKASGKSYPACFGF